jgi:hypothetical protein
LNRGFSYQIQRQLPLNQLTIGQFKLILIFLLIVCFLNHAYIPNNVIESIKEMDKNQNSKGYVMDV